MNNIGGNGSSSELTALDTVIKETMRTLAAGREQLFAVAENARSECSRIKNSMAETDSQLADVNSKLEAAQQEEEIVQARVAEVTGAFKKHSEDEIKAAYENVRELQVRLTLLKERREQLLQKKQDFETSKRNLQQTEEKAENMVSQVGVVMDFIGGNLRDINVKLESLQQRQQMGLQIVKAQEEERKRVAREIHDGPAQSMANVVLRMEFCEKLMEVEPAKVSHELKELKDIVRNNLQDMRKIIFDLRPMALDDLGVIPALKRYIEDFREKNDIDIEMNFFGKEARLEPVLEVALFRLIQEALNNIVKHAHASKVKVVVQLKDDLVKAFVEDDGIGFDLDDYLANQTGNNFGLVSMRERIDLLGGEMKIQTKPSRGTKVYFEVPLAR
ncbi:sensor histidine kinase [Phosphitispora sp. TUW77]|uniref:sensor histidine kinase n=1 Tax=Phosphitispora sp. TUW77 TaxID=3152361 RepID=UPI003AB35C8A